MFEPKFGRALIAVVSVAFILRVIPEILAGKWPLGFDTMTYYIPIILRWNRGNFNIAHFNSFVPLGYVLMFFVYRVSGNIFFTLKSLGPLLYGLLSGSFFFFIVKCFNWTNKKAFFTTLLFSTYFVSLRISWDFYRNMLGLTFFFLFLPFFRRFEKLPKTKKLLCSMIAMLVALSHEIVSDIMFFIVFASFIRAILKREMSAVKVFKLSLWFIPSLFILFSFAYMNSIIFQEVPGSINYLTDTTRAVIYSSYFELVSDTIILFFISYGGLLPFILMGFQRDQTLDLWLLICSVGSFWPLFYPWFEVIPWNRWMLMLNPVFIIYAANSIQKGKIMKDKLTLTSGSNSISFKQKLVFMTILSVGIAYMTLPLVVSPHLPVPTTIERLSFYIPNIYFNTFPIGESEDLEKSFKWVNAELDNNSVLIVHESLTGWAMLYISDEKNIINYNFRYHQDGLQEALSAGYERVYLIWWVDGYGLYGQKSASTEFEQVFASSRIAVYLYIKSSQ